MPFGGVAYDVATSAVIAYGVPGVGLAFATFNPIEDTQSQYGSTSIIVTSGTDLTIFDNQSLNFAVLGGAPTVGNSTLFFEVTYKVRTFAEIGVP